MTSRANRVVVVGLDGAVPTLIKEWADEGRLPTLRGLMARGTSAPARSILPGVTPINWASIATGAYPHTHGIVDFDVHLPGEPLDLGHDAFDSTLITAEFLWEAAASAGRKCLVMNFPGGWPPRDARVHWVGGVGSPSSHGDLQLCSSMYYVPAGPVPRDARLVSDGTLILGTPGGALGPTFAVSWRDHDITLRASDGTLIDVREDAWTPWHHAAFECHGSVSGHFRLRATRSAAGVLGLYCSQIYADAGFSAPTSLADEIAADGLEYVDYCGARGFDRGWVDAPTMLEEAEHKLKTMAASVAALQRRHDYDVVFVKTHLLDHLEHAFWGGFDPLSPWYGSDDAPVFEANVRRGYELADAFLADLQAALGPDFGMVVVSDHGQLPHLKAMSPNNVLAAAGLLKGTVSDDGPVVDWSQTRACAATCLGHVYVNLAGRDPEGIVRPEDYETVQAQIQDALLAVRDPETGERVVELAITNREAAALGQGGERAGDVIYAMRPGYSGDTNWFPLTADGATVVRVGPQHHIEADFGDRKFIAGKFGSVHGCSLPTVSLGRGTELATFMLAGPGIRAGYARAEHPELVDVAPTIADWIGIPAPRQAQGRVLRDVFVDRQDVRGGSDPGGE